MITAILNGYQRPLNLTEQYNALLAQSIQPSDIMLWYNAPDNGVAINDEIAKKTRSAIANRNFGVWSRFAYALNASTEYICIFDDDTIPGTRWFENCLTTIKETEGLLGTAGILYIEPPAPESGDVSYYNPHKKFGWYPGGNNEITTEVDILGHAWFFKREWLSTFWRELPDPQYNICGEDMHFSFMLQKYLGIPSYVPPHPKGMPDLWGSTKGWQGVDENSLWETNKKNSNGTPFKNLMNEFYVNQRRSGWRLVNDRY